MNFWIIDDYRNCFAVETLIVSYNLFQDDFSTPIHLACSHGDLEITKLLVQQGAKIESEDGNGLTPLLR